MNAKPHVLFTIGNTLLNIGLLAQAPATAIPSEESQSQEPPKQLQTMASYKHIPRAPMKVYGLTFNSNCKQATLKLSRGEFVMPNSAYTSFIPTVMTEPPAPAEVQYGLKFKSNSPKSSFLLIRNSIELKVPESSGANDGATLVLPVKLEGTDDVDIQVTLPKDAVEGADSFVGVSIGGPTNRYGGHSVVMRRMCPGVASARLQIAGSSGREPTGDE